MARPRIKIRWIVGTVLVIAIVGGCITAGFWQLGRLDDRRTINAQIRSRSSTTVELPRAGANTDDLIFRRVRVSGTYDASKEVLARFRSRVGVPGYEVVTPLLTNDGQTVLVDRGWIPLVDGDRWPVAAMAPKTGEVEVVGLLAPPEHGPLRLETRDDGTLVTGAIDPGRLADHLEANGSLYPTAVLADQGGAGVGAGFPVPVEPPDLTEGSHFSYAVQWFLFASVGILGYPVLLVRRGPLARRNRRPASKSSPE